MIIRCEFLIPGKVCLDQKMKRSFFLKMLNAYLCKTLCIQCENKLVKILNLISRTDKTTPSSQMASPIEKETTTQSWQVRNV